MILDQIAKEPKLPGGDKELEEETMITVVLIQVIHIHQVIRVHSTSYKSRLTMQLELSMVYLISHLMPAWPKHLKNTRNGC